MIKYNSTAGIIKKPKLDKYNVTYFAIKKSLSNINKVDLSLVWDPPWDKSMMSEAAKLELNL